MRSDTLLEWPCPRPAGGGDVAEDGDVDLDFGRSFASNLG